MQIIAVHPNLMPGGNLLRLAALVLAGTLPMLALETRFPITKDTYLDSLSGSQTTNFGTNGSVRVLVNSNTSVTRGLFAVPAELLDYAPGEILEAKVYFYVFQDNTKSRDIRLYPLTTSFVEGTGGSGASATGATWITRDGANNWTTPGGDFDASHFVVGVKEPVIDPDLNDRFFSWDITGLLNNPLTRPNLLNHGAILIIDGEDSPPASSSDRAPFTSSENMSNPVEFRPSLVVKLRMPTVSLSVPNPGEVHLSITNAKPGMSHRIERSYHLASPMDWSEVTTITPTETEFIVADTVPLTEPRAFYRVGVTP